MSAKPPGKTVFSARYSVVLQLLRQARLDAKLTQAQAAERLGRPQSFISKCESGERRIDVVELLDLCRVYKCDPRSMIERLDRERKT